MQGLCTCINLRVLVYPKSVFCLHFAKFCAPSHWNACFCSLLAFGGGARFSARFLGCEQFGSNLVILFVFGFLFVVVITVIVVVVVVVVVLVVFV